MIKTYKSKDGFIYRYDSETLLPIKEKRVWRWPLVTILFIVIIGITTPIGISQCKDVKKFLHIKTVPPLTEQNLLDSLVKWNCYFPELVIKQMKIESANFNSNIFHQTNNLMGMTYPSRRQTTAIGKYKVGKYTYAVYDNWVSSAKDYLLFQQTYFTEKYYHSFLENVGYAEDSSYINKIK